MAWRVWRNGSSNIAHAGVRVLIMLKSPRTSRKHGQSMNSTILYYTCCAHREDIEMACRKQLALARDGHGLISISLKPIDFGDENIVLPLQRSPESMHKQVYAGLQRATSDYIFLTESDVLYHESHFRFVPPRDDVFYYNINVWR